MYEEPLLSLCVQNYLYWTVIFTYFHQIKAFVIYNRFTDYKKAQYHKQTIKLFRGIVTYKESFLSLNLFQKLKLNAISYSASLRIKLQASCILIWSHFLLSKVSTAIRYLKLCFVGDIALLLLMFLLNWVKLATLFGSEFRTYFYNLDRFYSETHWEWMMIS